MDTQSGKVRIGNGTGAVELNTVAVDLLESVTFQLKPDESASFDLVGDGQSYVWADTLSQKLVLGGGSSIGTTEIRTGTIDIAGQATTVKISDSNAASLKIMDDASSTLLLLDTSGATDRLEILETVDVMQATDLRIRTI